MIRIIIFTIALFVIYDAKFVNASSLLIQIHNNLQSKLQYNLLTYRLNEKEHQLAKFYERKNFNPQWITVDGTVPAVSVMLETIKQADIEGLEPQDYMKKILKIENLLHPPYTLQSLNSLEILVSELVMDYIDDLFGERLNPKKVSPLLYINPYPIDASEVLSSGIENDPTGHWLRKLTISRPEYKCLKKLLARYRTLLNQETWKTIAAPKTFKNFKDNPVLISQLQTVLKQYEIFQEEVNGIFDIKTEKALINFQQLSGQEPDGLLGPETFKALNITLEERIKQIIVTMERWRWFPHDIIGQHVIVNIAGFILSGYKNEQEVLQMPIIIGQGLRKTPVFSSTIFEIRFNPIWHVPHSIAVKDKLPLLKQDPHTLATKGYIVRDQNGNTVNPLQINWSEVSASNFPFSLTQAPGAINALGRVFFNIQSPFSIFLHDTPDTNLFKKAKRNLSSGCIRVARPIDLALFILENYQAANFEFIQNKIDSNQTSSLHLPNPIPVHITYLTVWFDKEERYHFADDIYGLDKEIWDALQRRTQALK
jgi:murein L,D-transpeptidase YcbB/YkuD